MSNASRGHARERQVRDWYAKRDWLTFRAPASLGVADVIALKAGEKPHLVEVKCTSRGPYHGFLPADRARLSMAARMAGAVALLAWWPSRGQLVFIPESEWPS